MNKVLTGKREYAEGHGKEKKSKRVGVRKGSAFIIQ